MELLWLLIALAAWFFIWRFSAKKIIATGQKKAIGHFVGAAAGFFVFVIIIVIVATSTEKKTTPAAPPETPAEEQPAAPMSRDQAKAFAMTYLNAIYDSQQTITNSGSNPEQINIQYWLLSTMTGKWPQLKEQPALTEFFDCLHALNSYKNMIDNERTSEQTADATKEFKTDLVACEACLQSEQTPAAKKFRDNFAALEASLPCVNLTYKIRKEVREYYRFYIYPDTYCDSKVIDGEQYMFCHPEGEDFGGLYLVECDGDNYQIYAVNGKAKQHASPGLNAEPLNELRDIPAILEHF